MNYFHIPFMLIFLCTITAGMPLMMSESRQQNGTEKVAPEKRSEPKSEKSVLERYIVEPVRHAAHAIKEFAENAWCSLKSLVSGAGHTETAIASKKENGEKRANGTSA